MARTPAANEIELFPDTVAKPKRTDTTSTFKDNISLPVHRWFRYSAGFSAVWAQQIIQEEKVTGRNRILDPFTGSGTVLLAGELAGVETIGMESHPFVNRVALAKLLWRENPKHFSEYAESILAQAQGIKGIDDDAGIAPILERVFPAEVLSRLLSLRHALAAADRNDRCYLLAWLALAGILRECSPVGTAQWQYLLPNKSKARVTDPYEAYRKKIRLIATDMQERQSFPSGPHPILYSDDSREQTSVPTAWAQLVITSPPYANNYDYADATRLEMSFFGEISGWSDLQGTVRKHLVRSCTQHVSSICKQTFDIIEEPLLAPIRDELLFTCQQLDEERKLHAGKKPYHTMIAAYFSDLAKIWHELRRVSAEGVKVCFVVGDSAPYGVYVPVDRWLGELAKGAGFDSYSFIKTRDRNIKWENRKHRVPLHEGQLWVEG